MKFPHVDIVKPRKWWIGLSLLITVPGIVGIIWSCIVLGAPVRLGIDFTGGSILQYQFDKPVELQEIREVLEKSPSEELHGAQVQGATIAGKEVVIMRTKAMADDMQDESIRKGLKETLRQKFGEFKILSEDKVSGVVGPELLTSGLLSLFLTFAAMVAYIKFRFRFDFAVCAIIALVHDVVILVGLFAILGLVPGVHKEVDSLFISAVLTVIGFSVHDTIVVFDRIRENQKYVGSFMTDPKTGEKQKRTFGDVANDSINQTLARSIYTSLTVIITLTALYVLGGSTTKDFVLAMLIGIISGTYSSIFNASCLLVWWNEIHANKKSSAKPSATSSASPA
ncbi:MAG: protein translocase subunit SecF [Candidatus Obscuribacterales bacterium]|nr:protein translocase subunit SecF [Candidatus Obscuribacterales bacterium]